LKPTTSENVDISVLNTNFDLTDANVGAQVVTSSTRPSGGALYSGCIIYETDTHLLNVYDGSSWIEVGNADDTFKVKTSASNTISTIFADDGHLIGFPVAANATYMISGALFYGGLAVADIKVQFVFPAAATLSIATQNAELSTASNVSTLMNVSGVVVGTTPVAPNSAIGLSGGTTCGLFSGVLTTGATAGTWKVQFAQFAANASPSSLFQGSHFRSVRVA
jgi:hypothetical protein